MQLYTYSAEDRLRHPLTYFYTPYHGAPFLTAWKEERQRVQDLLGLPMPPPLASVRKRIELPPGRGPIETGGLLEQIYGDLADPAVAKKHEIRATVDMLVKKFEVDKRWYLSYGPRLRTLDREDASAYGHVALYVRAAEIFEAAYRQYGAMPYLNVLLKSLDTLISIQAQLDPDQKRRLSWLIARESEYVELLLRRMKISL